METAEPQSCVAYYRVSTQQQGKSGLGLEGQQIAVRAHLDKTSRKLIAELIEIESAGKPDRPKLLEALTLCRLTRSKFIVARLDRLVETGLIERLGHIGRASPGRKGCGHGAENGESRAGKQAGSGESHSGLSSGAKSRQGR